jgi:hypothetical protein
MSQYLTRISWNTNGWTHPQGLGPLAEGPARGGTETFVSENGYGHEEWLFRPEHRIEGWQYGFVQPSLKVREDRYGEVLDAVLYTIAPSGARFHLGRIEGMEILDLEQAITVRDHFDDLGWSAEMADDLTGLGLATANLRVSRERSREFVNVRFRPQNIHMLPKPILAGSDDVTRQKGKNRYQFYPLDELPSCLVGTPADPTRPTRPYRYQAAPVVYADRRHNRLQLRLVELLRAKYGAAAVRMEVDGVDVLLDVGGKTTLIEVKSDVDARLAVRAALGQLLEYALLAKAPSTFPALVVAAPQAPDAAVAAYLAELKARFSLPLAYVQIDESTTVCPL